MLCPLCLPFTQSILTDTPVAITHTRPHTPDHALTTTTPTSSEIADGINHQRPCSFHHYPHYRELEGSARAGCELCSLIVNSTSSRPRQNRRQAELQREKPVQFWLPRISKTDDLDAKLRFRVNVGIDTGIDKFSLHLEFYKRCDPASRWKPWTSEDPPRRFPIMQSANSETGYRLAMHWQQGCSQLHGSRCGPTVSVLPTRVLDVGEEVDEQNAETVNLLLTYGKEDRYTALSHCWGPPAEASKVIVTTTPSLAARQTGILISDLPQNFQDAITVTRRLKIRYLWVDSLCIIQDSASDWSEEAGKMGDYYSRATITLSALCAPTSHSGFLRDRWTEGRQLDLPLQEFENFNIRKVTNPFGLASSPPPLWQRAWVVQERALASRILHFGAEQMYWECRTAVVHEDGWKYSTSVDSPLGPGCSGVLTGKKHVEKVWNTWYKLVEQYSKRTLTKESDRLPALGGLASKFGQLLGSEYLAGLWRVDLIRGLLWTRRNDSNSKVAGYTKGEKYSERRARRILNIEKADSMRPTVTAGIPSWSWAALGGPVNTLPQLVAVCEIEEAKVTLTGPAFLGLVSNGEIKLLGSLVKAEVERFTKPTGPRASLRGFGSLRPVAVMDFVGTRSDSSYFFHVASDKMKYYWLVLELCEGEAGEYHRIGTLCTNNEEQEAMLKIAVNSKVTII